MVKETPGVGKIVAMIVFTMSCFGILLFLWLTFGGSIPLRPEGYRIKASFPEAATLAQEADVRLAGVNVGKVKTKQLEKRAARTLVEIEIDPEYAPIPADTRAILRQKTLLGETYVELTPGGGGSRSRRGDLQDGDRLADVQVEETVELDEIFNAFDEDTRSAFQEWVGELSKSIKGGRGEDLNDAFGNLEGFSVDGARLLGALDAQQTAVRQLVRNTGQVFGAINEREGALRGLIVNGNNTFEALASRDEALAETFQIFPTFLDESKATLARLETFSNDTRPLVNKLGPVADDLGPTVRDLGDLAPDLEGLFRDLDPLIGVGNRTLPDLERFLRGGEPVFEAAHLFFPELNPILSLLNFHQATVAGFITNGAPDLAGDFGGNRGQTQIGLIDPRSFIPARTRESSVRFDRGNAYPSPNYLNRAITLGAFEAFSCAPAGGEIKDADDQLDTPGPLAGLSKRPPCFESPASLYSGKKFNLLRRGRAPNVPAPQGIAGTRSAIPSER